MHNFASKAGSQHNNLGASRTTKSKFHSMDPQILSAAVPNLVSTATRCLGYARPWHEVNLDVWDFKFFPNTVLLGCDPFTNNTHAITHAGTISSLTYLLTPWSRVLLEKLTDSAASQEIPRIFGTRRFLTVPTSARHLSLSWAKSIQSPQLPPTS